MSNIDYYELVRQKLRVGKLGAPKHKKVIDFLKVIWTEEDVKLLCNMDGIGKLITARKLAEKVNLDKKQVKKMLDKMAEKGTILKIGSQYTLLPFVPGIFEFYYLNHKDTEENLKKAAEIFDEIIDEVLPSIILAAKEPVFLPKLPFGAKEKIIEVNKSIETDSEILPYELVEEMINKNDFYAKMPCQCRMVGEYVGNPCKVAPPDIGCFIAGPLARQFVMMGIAQELTKEEAIDYLKRAEKAGLVHNGGNISGGPTHMLICNCCSCHCGGLYPTFKYRVPGVKKSNFTPIINNNSCIKCETCIKKCPMGAIFHRWPMEEDNSDEMIIIKTDLCIGCGVCAINCPKEAIKMQRVNNEIAPESFPVKISGIGL
ncbi:MAG: 4Fe-4S dicluster domain-containing protein [Candidatus Helarchaeota archaeon]